MANLRGLILCVLGGDRREVELSNSLVGCCAEVRCFGIPEAGISEAVRVAERAEDACRGADAIILPLSGTDAEGNVRVSSHPVQIPRELLRLLKPGARMFVGSVKPAVASLCAATGITVIETGENDELAILNSIPSAEGAILMAIQATPFTIHASNCLVLGLGRTGLTLARMVKGIGANVWAAARKPKDRARAFEMGFVPVSFEDLSICLPQMDIVFNTVPALVLDRALVYTMKHSAAIIDLASAPGGVDFSAAKERGIHAELAPGLPGKVAPLTAGRVLGRVIPELVAESFGRRS